MGRTSKKTSSIKEQDELFDLAAIERKVPRSSFNLEVKKVPDSWKNSPPHQTNSKSRLIAKYIELFQKVTKGGLYIDGFSGPQSRKHEDAWTARRILEIEPKRLRTFWLCELEQGGINQLRSLKEQHHNNPKGRRVFVIEGDFNKSIHIILKSGRFTRRSAIFALLDQRNTECHWSSVQALANYAGRTKIELLYFLGTSWLTRSLSQSKTPSRLEEINKWWGGDNWHFMTELNQVGQLQCMTKRFSEELGYEYVNAYPIMQNVSGKKVSFYLIHASDHPDAPILMTRAYRQIVGDIEGTPSDSQRDLFGE